MRLFAKVAWMNIHAAREQQPIQPRAERLQHLHIIEMWDQNWRAPRHLHRLGIGAVDPIERSQRPGAFRCVTRDTDKCHKTTPSPTRIRIMSPSKREGGARLRPATKSH